MGACVLGSVNGNDFFKCKARDFAGAAVKASNREIVQRGREKECLTRNIDDSKLCQGLVLLLVPVIQFYVSYARVLNSLPGYRTPSTAGLV